MLRLYNTMSGRKEILSHEGEEVKIYTCGPTVYDFAHIGNFRAYIVHDMLRRYLKFKGFKVRQVMNITDVDDKTIKRSREEGISLKEYTARYEKAFFEDMKAVNIERVEHYPRATEHISDMVKIIKVLLEKGYAYYARDKSIYFDISRFRDYGKLSGIKISSLKEGARVKQDEYAKNEARDFALWKAYSKEDGEVFWETDIGKGRPGWHIECSAMSMRYLGETLDIHAGGVDLIFPHHENEIAQSEACTGRQFSKLWVHNEHLLVEGRKMSKSLGNFFTLRELLDRGYNPMAIRYLLLATHYKRKLNFTFKALKDAEITLKRLEDFTDRIAKLEVEGGSYMKENIDKVREKFFSALDDNLDTPKALSYIFTIVKEVSREISSGKVGTEDKNEIIRLINDFNYIFAVLQERKNELPEELRRLIKEREEARARGEFKKADGIRDYLLSKGIEIEDTREGTGWRWRI
ncbi:MAG TPA: cysteine--tRNA ligase [Euryarchaeota archaeon]|nr:cysteine--tRNA ligase [archaeon BMS3Bbin15]HDL15180.1 cysteine--tRNA ligase [Euryarchaeota archaeon]